MTEYICKEARLSYGQEGLERLGRLTYAREGVWDTVGEDRNTERA